MVLLRRFLVIGALLFWQGGFTFYAAVVVPVGQQVLGHLRQGFITRQVTWYLNLSGAIALVPLAWDLFVPVPHPWRQRLRALLWAIMLFILVWLYSLHQRLDALLVPKGYLLLDEEAFRPNHRLYLWLSTVQWGCSLLFLLLTLQGWRDMDRTSTRDDPRGGEGNGPG